MNIILAITTIILLLLLAGSSIALSECRNQLKWLRKIKGIEEDDNV